MIRSPPHREHSKRLPAGRAGNGRMSMERLVSPRREVKAIQRRSSMQPRGESLSIRHEPAPLGPLPDRYQLPHANLDGDSRENPLPVEPPRPASRSRWPPEESSWGPRGIPHFGASVFNLGCFCQPHAYSSGRTGSFTQRSCNPSGPSKPLIFLTQFKGCVTSVLSARDRLRGRSQFESVGRRK